MEGVLTAGASQLVVGATQVLVVARALALSAADPTAVFPAADPASVLLSLGWYRSTMFDSYNEVHAFQLGAYAGVLVVALRARGYRHVPTALTLALLAFALGFPDVYDVCRRSGEACGSLPVQTQPWYFLTGLIGAGVAGPRVARRLRRLARRAYRRAPEASGRLSNGRSRVDDSGGARTAPDGGRPTADGSSRRPGSEEALSSDD